MTDEQKQLIAKANNSIKAAQILFNEEIYDVSTSRAYYAMFYREHLSLALSNYTHKNQAYH